MYNAARATMKQLGTFMCFRRSAAAQRAELESQIRAARQRMQQRRRDAIAMFAVLTAASTDAVPALEPRRVVTRAAGKWRGSTLFGYL